MRDVPELVRRSISPQLRNSPMSSRGSGGIAHKLIVGMLRYGHAEPFAMLNGSSTTTCVFFVGAKPTTRPTAESIASMRAATARVHASSSVG